MKKTLWLAVACTNTCCWIQISALFQCLFSLAAYHPKPTKSWWNGGNGACVCVFTVRILTDHSLNTPGGLHFQQSKITTTDLKMTLGCLLSRCGQGKKKRINQQPILKAEKLHSRRSCPSVQNSTGTRQMQRFRPQNEMPCSGFIDLGRLTVQKLLKVVDKELSQGRPFGPLQSIEQLLDFGGDATVDCNTYTVGSEDMTRRWLERYRQI